MVVPGIELASTRMLPWDLGLLMPLSTLMLFAIVTPVEFPSTLIPEVVFL